MSLHPSPFSDLRSQTGRLIRATALLPAPRSLADSSSSYMSGSTDDLIRMKFRDSRVFECFRSTLTNGGGYLAARFRLDSLIPPGAEFRDANGQSVYFIERSGRLFENHILPYIVEGDPYLPLFAQDPMVWRQLRSEAEFYALDGLSEFLNVTKTFELNPAGHGVLYWLGTGKGAHEYRNPFDIGHVHVGGWVDMTREELEAQGGEWPFTDIEDPIPELGASSFSSRRALVQYRPPIRGLASGSYMLNDVQECDVFHCGAVRYRNPVIVDLQSITICPTAYSLRYSMCYGMKDWNLEGSSDGSTWHVPHLVAPTDEEIANLTQYFDERGNVPEEEMKDILLAYVEFHHRHTWNIASEEFFRYFRFIGLGPLEWHPALGFCPVLGRSIECMHGIGLELYGDVHED